MARKKRKNRLWRLAGWCVAAGLVVAVGFLTIHWASSSDEGPRFARRSADGGGRSGPSAASAADPEAEMKDVEGRGPLETVRLAHAYRLAGNQDGLRGLLVPEQAGAVLEYVAAADELAQAATLLKRNVEREIGPASAARFDRTGVVDSLGFLSRSVECLDQRVEDHEATVSVCVAGRLPLDQVRLVRREGRWLIRTDPPVPGLAAEFRRLAGAFAEVADAVERRHFSAREIEAELEARQRPILERIRQLGLGAGGGAGGDES